MPSKKPSHLRLIVAQSPIMCPLAIQDVRMRTWFIRKIAGFVLVTTSTNHGCLAFIADHLSTLLQIIVQCPIRRVEFIDITHILHRLTSDLLCGNDLYVVEPQVWIEAFCFGHVAQLDGSARTAVVGGERKQLLI